MHSMLMMYFIRNVLTNMFRRYCCHLQGDVIITRIGNVQI